MEGIQVSVERTGVNKNIAVIKVGGYIDTTTSAELEHSLDTLLKQGIYKIIIDLGNVDYISSAGWGIFISEIKGIRERGGDLKLVRMIPDVYEVFELLEFHYILKAFDALEDAVSDFEKGGANFAEKPAAVSAAPKASNVPGGGADSMVAQQTATATANRSQKAPNSIEDRVRAAVISDPEAGTFKLKKILKSNAHGNTSIGFFELRGMLKKLRLDSKQKRIQFFRQRATR